MMTAVDDHLGALLELTDELVEREVRPAAAAAEESGRFPRELFTVIGRAGLLGLPYPVEYGGGGLPYEAYLQVVEKLAAGWLAIGLGVSVHTLACFPVAAYGSADQRAQWLPGMLGGEMLGAYCLSEPHCGSDAAALRTRAVRDPGGYTVDGVKAWITHGGAADFYALFARTSGDGTGPGRAQGISCLHVPAGHQGYRPRPPERKMGMRASVTTQMIFEGARCPPAISLVRRARDSRSPLRHSMPGGSASRPARPGSPRRRLTPRSATPGSGSSSAGRSSSSTASRSCSPTWPRRWRPPVRSTARGHGARTKGCHSARRRRWPSCSHPTRRCAWPPTRYRYCGGYGYVSDFPAERYLREAKMLQIVEGTNQIQRLVIGRALARF